MRWTLFKLTDRGPQLLQTDTQERQREPCPLGIFNDGWLLLTANPTITGSEESFGSAKSQLLIFDTKKTALCCRCLFRHGQPSRNSVSTRIGLLPWVRSIMKPFISKTSGMTSHTGVFSTVTVNGQSVARSRCHGEPSLRASNPFEYATTI